MNNSINQREKVFSLIYVILLFAFFTTLFCWILFYTHSGFRSFSQKEFAVEKMNHIKAYQQAQIQYLPIVDSLKSQIERFDPSVNAVYEENDIYYMINTLKNVYEKKSWDIRYKSFLQVADFYDMWFIDKKELWNKKKNIAFFKKNLEECEIGLTRKSDELKSTKK